MPNCGPVVAGASPNGGRTGYVVYGRMTTDTQKLLQSEANWPRENQEELAGAAHLIEARRNGAYRKQCCPYTLSCGGWRYATTGSVGSHIYSSKWSTILQRRSKVKRCPAWRVARKRRITTESHRPDAGAGAGCGVDISLPFHGSGLK